MEYKVGNWCVCINLDDNVTGKIGHVFQIGRIDTDILEEYIWYYYTEETSISGQCLHAKHFRLALPHEVPGYIPPKPENYKYLVKLFKKLKIK